MALYSPQNNAAKWSVVFLVNAFKEIGFTQLVNPRCFGFQREGKCKF